MTEDDKNVMLATLEALETRITYHRLSMDKLREAQEKLVLYQIAILLQLAVLLGLALVILLGSR